MPREAAPNNGGQRESVADELKLESERLRLLAEKLQLREEALAEMEKNYPTLLRFTHAKLQEEFARTLEELPADVDLHAYAEEQGAVAHDVLMEELEIDLKRLKEGP